eukprot:TRINITY_DN12393_c0_g1_i4.p1 TRINITY_DN12393_c0_g1~~TRINITY_DN12393_c0_g1_i4.p1  ORF type:complete len:507 (+),score=45.29 TRINITY_DN12393_c0_g1_i4:174-1694(+)
MNQTQPANASAFIYRGSHYLQVCEELYTDITEYHLGVWSLTMFIFLLMVYACVEIIRHRNFNQIKQRSPFLLCSIAICTAAPCFVFGIQIFLYHLYPGNPDYCPFNPNSSVFHRLTVCFRLISAYPQVLRGMRICYAFNVKKKHRFFDYLFNSEWKLIFLQFLLGMIVVIFYQQYYNSIPLHNTKVDDYGPNVNFTIFFNFWEFVMWTEIFLIIITFYCLRKVKEDLKFVGEFAILLFCFEFLDIFRRVLVYFNTDFNQVSNPMIPTIFRILPLSCICYYNRFVVVLLLCVFIPLQHRNKNYMPLATRLVANIHDFEIFIADDQCYEFFEKYLSYLKKHSSKKQLEAYYGYEYLECYLDLKLKLPLYELREKNEFLGTLAKKYVLCEENERMFPDHLTLEIRASARENNLYDEEDFAGIYQYSCEQLRIVYSHHFVRTNSYRYIQKHLGEQERIEERLFKLQLKPSCQETPFKSATILFIWNSRVGHGSISPRYDLIVEVFHFLQL